jgi:hypothetical protein
MKSLFENFIAGTWNRLTVPRRSPPDREALDVGPEVVDDRVTSHRVTVPQLKRREHLALFGRTGVGKTSCILRFQEQDIRQGHGFITFHFHGETTPAVLRRIARQERLTGTDLSSKVIIVSPGDAQYSVGINLLESETGEQPFIRIAELAQLLRQQWHLDNLGARTEELLRNSLHLLADNRLTLVDLPILLTNEAFRGSCLRRSNNTEVEAYFRSRFDRASEAMQAVYRDPVLNKVSNFISDPHFRHIIGQQRSTFSLIDAMDNGYWVIFDLDKGQLGEEAATFGSVLLTRIKNVLFRRRRRDLVTVYCDEAQNLLNFPSGLETLFQESRKYSVGIVSSTQYLDALPAEVRSAIMAIGTHAFFQLSSSDAQIIGSALDGGKRLGELLKNLPQRHLVVKSGHERWRHAMIPTVEESRVDYTDLYNRCRARWSRRRVDIEAEIRARHRQANQGSDEVLGDDWE